MGKTRNRKNRKRSNLIFFEPEKKSFLTLSKHRSAEYNIPSQSSDKGETSNQKWRKL